MRDEFVQFMTEYVQITRTEAGNITFEMTAHLDDPATFTMVECWRDIDAVRQHFEQPYVGGFRAMGERSGLEIDGTVTLTDRVEPVLEWLRSLLTATTTTEGAPPA